MAKKKTLKQLAKECSRDLAAQSWWYAPDIEEAFKRGWMAKAKQMRGARIILPRVRPSVTDPP